MIFPWVATVPINPGAAREARSTPVRPSWEAPTMTPEVVPYTYIADLAATVEPPDGGILSRTIYQDERIKVVAFGFGADQELSEHTASVPATIQVVRGEGTVTLGDDTVRVAAGSWIHMKAGLSHALRARTPMSLVLVMHKSGGAAS
jgi:quercetin dioxygenase-like cupin family protein